MIVKIYFVNFSHWGRSAIGPRITSGPVSSSDPSSRRIF